MYGIMELLLYWGSGGLIATLILHIQSILPIIRRISHLIRNSLPPEVYSVLQRCVSYISTPFHYYVSQILSSLHESSIVVKQFHNDCHNDCFEAVQYYISSKSHASVQVQELFRPKNSNSLSYTIEPIQMFEEIYDGFKVKWSLHNSQTIKNTSGRPSASNSMGAACYQVTFMKMYMEKIQSSYIPHVIKEGDKMKSKHRKRFLYTNRSGGSHMSHGGLWSNVPFSHSSTFDTMALDPILKEDIKTDLTKFLHRREYYERVGKTWKRGYLLYGPPGTGKTSLIAAISNFLDFDIYDLELTGVHSNSSLRKLLLSTSSKSIIVVEDIDCSVDLSDRNKKMTVVKDDETDPEKEYSRYGMARGRENTISLSGVLSFADGLWSLCGEERLMIFMTNNKDKLDQALLRPGRMDKHIHLSYCQIEAFKILMKSYLGTDQHELVKEVEELLPLVMMTPADIAEIFMGVEDDTDKGMKNVIEAMKKRLNQGGQYLANEEQNMGGSVHASKSDGGTLFP